MGWLRAPKKNKLYCTESISTGIHSRMVGSKEEKQICMLSSID